VDGCGRSCGGHGDMVEGCDFSRENMSPMMGQCGRERDRCGKTRGSEMENDMPRGLVEGKCVIMRQGGNE
jgi:hypothetical protein